MKVTYFNDWKSMKRGEIIFIELFNIGMEIDQFKGEVYFFFKIFGVGAEAGGVYSVKRAKHWEKIAYDLKESIYKFR